MADEAFVTCVTNDTYALGALVLGYSLRNVQTTRQLAVIITRDVSDKIREQLATIFDHIELVDTLDSKDEMNLALLTRPDLGVTFTKFHCWRLTRYRKCVFLDADTMVLQNCDELFDRDELSAVPDVGWPDCFNSGVFVYTPNEETYKNILKFAVAHGSFDGGDQGVLNMFFSDWRTSDISKHLSFIYNMNANVVYTYLPAYKQFGKDVKIVHFLGAIKPWMQMYNSDTGRVQPDSPHSFEHLQMWWDLFIKFVQPKLSHECKGLAGDLARMHISWPSGGKPQSSEARQFAWERGQIDYMGADAFANIEKKLQSAINDTNSSSKPDTEPRVPLKIEMPPVASPYVEPPTPTTIPTAPKEAQKAPTTPPSPKVATPTQESPKVATPTKESPKVATPTKESPKVASSPTKAPQKVDLPPKEAAKVQSPTKVPAKVDLPPKEAPKVESPTKAQPAPKAAAAAATQAKPEPALKKQSSLGEPAKKGAAAAEAEKKTAAKKDGAAQKKEQPKKAPPKKSPK